MEQETRTLAWVTPAKHVGPAMLIVMLIAVIAAVWFASDQKFAEAIIALLVAICFLLVGIADLLGALLAAQENRPRQPVT